MQVAEAGSASDALGPLAAAPLPAGLGQQMGQQWRAGEAAYLAGMARIFALLRGERGTYPGHYAAVRSVYLTYLQRPAQDKQQKVGPHLLTWLGRAPCNLCSVLHTLAACAWTKLYTDSASLDQHGMHTASLKAIKTVLIVHMLCSSVIAFYHHLGKKCLRCLKMKMCW